MLARAQLEDGLFLRGIERQAALPRRGEVSVDIADQVCVLPANHELAGKSAITPYDLRDIDFTLSDMVEADFYGADLRGSKFAGVDLFGANFHGADLRGVTFEGANLKNAILTDAQTEGANFDAAIMPDGKRNE